MTARSLLAILAFFLFTDTPLSAEAKRPNILWLTCEDMSPNLGCYGDKLAVTPNLDRFATQAVRYTHAFSVAGVCAPSRSCLITGMYPTTLGSHYMRCQATLPSGVLTFSEHLRNAGYYCTNNVKTDYNFAVPKGAWDRNNNAAHWRGRPDGKPFFAIFNNTITHESQIRAPKPKLDKDAARHDPARVVVPPFHPDSPEVRRDWARMFDLITTMDKWFGDKLAELEKDGLADDTIVFFYSDHGVGLPRGKRWLYDTGMRVPLMVRFGKNWAHLAPSKAGTTTDRLVSFVDFGPTALSLAGVKPPANMQGVAFLGTHAGPPREVVYGIRDRMDERNDTTRAVRDRRYKYIRNYHTYKPWAQTLEYMEHMPTMQAWRKLASAGKLDGPASLWMRPTKPFEELYDTEEDPHEIRNLVDDPKHTATLSRLRARHLAWCVETRDLGLMPEALVHERSKGRTRFELGQDAAAFPQAKLVAAAEAVARKDVDACIKLLADRDSALRWWGATGLGVAGGDDAALTKALDDAAPIVRVAAADGLRRRGLGAKVLPTLTKCLKDDNPWVRHAAALAIDEFGPDAAPVRAALEAAKGDDNQYVVRVVSHTLGVLGAEKK